MSLKERRRVEVLSRVRDSQLSVAVAAGLLHVSQRQAWRLKGNETGRERDGGADSGLCLPQPPSPPASLATPSPIPPPLRRRPPSHGPLRKPEQRSLKPLPSSSLLLRYFAVFCLELNRQEAKKL